MGNRFTVNPQTDHNGETYYWVYDNGLDYPLLSTYSEKAAQESANRNNALDDERDGIQPFYPGPAYNTRTEEWVWQ